MHGMIYLGFSATLFPMREWESLLTIPERRITKMTYSDHPFLLSLLTFPIPRIISPSKIRIS